MHIDIKSKLEEKHMSRYELAKRIGVTYPTIDNIYKGTPSSIKFEILEALCKELNCSLDEILIFDDENLSKQQAQRLFIYLSALEKLSKNKGDTSE